ncbi:hypothetical protein HU200_013343 [Digitaria exilis]|uniref:poly(A)-specific ribonuclease n=1 Tax=Digitaria exilis TaxID=1010633 RepID=A0A834ZXK2_9POAL|nr:hypothetical protein HU200_066822 [Digitaria exilis]KAF8746411.1 hypothetical protein HU200_013343 [Digitaria exilis]
MFPYPPPSFPAMGPFVGPPRFPPPPPYGSVPYYGGGIAAVQQQPAAAHVLPVQIQSVTAVNLDAELDQIAAFLPLFPYVVVDTEYPGTVHLPSPGKLEPDLTPDERYALVRANVDELPIVQLGLTLCDGNGNLPVVFDHFIGQTERAWEFNFCDFDVGRHRHVPHSVEFLKSQGIDFHRASQCGVSSAAFKDKLAGILEALRGSTTELTWVAFGGAYDMAYLVKMLSNFQPLPETREDFIAQVRTLLGGRVFDAKYMAENCGRGDLRGVGLRNVAVNLGVPKPIVEQPCLAGPKSLTACRIHTIMRMHVLSQDDVASHEGLIDGLQ